MPIENAASLLNTLKDCLATKENAQACGEALLNSARANPVAAGLYTAGAVVLGGAILFRKPIMNKLCSKSTESGKDASASAKGDTSPPLAESTVRTSDPVDDNSSKLSHDTDAAPEPREAHKRGKSPGRKGT